MISKARRAGHTLRIKAPALAEAVVDEQYRLQPDLADRYGPDGRRCCARDVAHRLQFLAASVEWDEPHRFAGYVTWAHGVLAAHGIPAGDFRGTLVAMRRVLPTLVPPSVAERVVPHLEAGWAAFEEAEATTTEGAVHRGT